MKLRRRKLVVAPFHKGTRHPFIANFEEVFLYGVITKLTIHTDVVCRDLATGLERANLHADAAFAQILKELQKLCQASGARYVLTGSMQPSFNGGDNLSEVKVALRLYDGEENRFCVDDIHVFSDFGVTKGVSPGSARMDVSMKSMNAMIDWACTHIVKNLTPDDRRTIERMDDAPVSSSYEALNYLVQAQKKTDHKDKLLFYESAVRADDKLEVAYYDLASILRSEREYEKSVLNYRKALEVSKGTAHLKALYANDAGIVCALMGRDDLALQWWKKAIELAPDYLNPYFNAANVYEDKDDYGQAETFFRKAQVLAADDERTYFNLARIYSKQGNWARALEQYQGQLQFSNTDPWCHSDIANCYLNLGQPDQAKKHLERTVALDADGEAGEFAKFILAGLTG